MEIYESCFAYAVPAFLTKSEIDAFKQSFITTIFHLSNKIEVKLEIEFAPIRQRLLSSLYL